MVGLWITGGHRTYFLFGFAFPERKNWNMESKNTSKFIRFQAPDTRIVPPQFSCSQNIYSFLNVLSWDNTSRIDTSLAMISSTENLRLLDQKLLPVKKIFFGYAILALIRLVLVLATFYIEQHMKILTWVSISRDELQFLPVSFQCLNECKCYIVNSVMIIHYIIFTYVFYWICTC